MNNYYFLTSNGNFVSDDELYHWGIKGMRWGVRRYQNEDGSLTAAGKRRQRENNGEILTRKIARKDDPEDRKARIDADIKEADDRVKFYGSKRAAKAAIKDEADYAKSVNRGKAAMDTLKYGSIGAVPVGVLAALYIGEASASVLGLSAFGPVGLALGIGAAAANRYINKHAQEQIAYTDESEYAHDIVVTMKKT